MLAERAGLRIHEVPVDWIDDTDSRVDIVATALADLRGIVRLGVGLLRGTIKVPTLRDSAAGAFAAGHPRGRQGRAELGWQIAGFAAIGVASTVAYLLLFLLLRSVMPAQAANALSLLVTAVANTAANRRLHVRHPGPARAAGTRPRADRVRHRPGADRRRPGRAARGRPRPPSRGAEVAVLVAANLVATLRGSCCTAAGCSAGGASQPRATAALVTSIA